MKYFFVLSLLLLLVHQSFAQNNSDTIVLRKNFFAGTRFYINNEKKSPREINGLLLSVPESRDELIKAGRNATISLVVFGIGAGVWIAGLIEKNGPTSLAGAGIVVLSLPFTTASGIHLRRSIRRYNEQIHK